MEKSEMRSPAGVLQVLDQLIATPSLAKARELESILRSSGFERRILGRLNQKSSIDAAAESDRGITERIANAFDASLTAARRLAGVDHSSRSLTPRVAAQRFLCTNPDHCVWEPKLRAIAFGKPTVQFWSDDNEQKLRFRKYKSPEGIVTVLVRDTSLGITRDEMAKTILDLNSDDKLKAFEAIGQFGHGGSSTLAFCESCLIVTSPRFSPSGSGREFYWTLIFPETEDEASKQSVVRKWFCQSDDLPLVDDLDGLPALDSALLPGTSIWHFGYIRGSWLKTPVGTHQDTPAGRLGRLLFSYPLPFEIYGELARGDTSTGARSVKGAYYRLLEDRTSADPVVEYRSGEKTETLRVEGTDYGQLSVFVFVLKDRAHVRNYVDNKHPVIITLNGQNHGEMTQKLLVDANLPEISASSIVEIRLDALDEEALSNIISNSREMPKNSPFTRALTERVCALLAQDESLLEIERRRQDEKASQSSEELNHKISRFLAAILSDATAEPADRGRGDAPGTRGVRGAARPEIPAADPPDILEFLSTTALFVPEGTAKMLKFKSDARPPKYSFHGGNPRCFARLVPLSSRVSQLSISGKADIDGRGYGSLTLSCSESPANPVSEREIAGKIEITLQATDGRTLTAKIDVGVCPKPEPHERQRRQSVRPEIIFCAPSDADMANLASLILEKSVHPFASQLEKYRDLLSITERECAYWGEKFERSGESWLMVEINVGHPRLVSLLRACPTAEERIRVKERIVEDIVLDCYQHAFRLDDLPEIVQTQVQTDPDDLARASEICLNYDKSIRLASIDRGQSAARGDA